MESFNRPVGQHFIENAHKPSVKNYLRAMGRMGTDRSNTIFIGDQLFTISGGSAPASAIFLVRPMDPREEIQIVLKRYLEKIVLYFYLRGKRQGR